MKRILILAAAVLVTFIGGSPAWADMRRSAVDVGGYVFHSNFDSESNIEDDEGLGARLGILFTEQHELEFSFEHITTQDEFFGFDVDLDTFKVGYLFNFVPEAAISPFITVGGGFQQLSIDAFDQDETDPMAFAGGGVRFFIGNVFHIRVDGLIEAVLPDGEPGDALYDGLLQAGVGWVIGGR